MDVPRVRTHIDGLDDRIGGGVPGGHVVLLSGLPGTMKSSLSYSILYRNAMQADAPGLYVSLEQTKGSLERQMSGMGFDTSEVKDLLTIVDVATLRKDLGRTRAKIPSDFLRRTIDTRRQLHPVSLLVLDSLEALEILGRSKDPRAEVFDLFEWLRDLGATSFVLTEAPPEASAFPGEAGPSLRDDASYLADGVVHLKMHHVTDLTIQRRLRVVKMRGTAHETGYFALVFEDGKFGVTPALSV